MKLSLPSEGMVQILRTVPGAIGPGYLKQSLSSTRRAQKRGTQQFHLLHLQYTSRLVRKVIAVMSTASDEIHDETPVPATPDNEEAEAAAEVAAMGLADARGEVAEQMTGDFEIIDESGELVKSRFLSFLMN